MASASAIVLGPLDLAVASGLVVAAGLVSALLRLGLARSLAVAALRTVVQLTLIGYLLSWIFHLSSAPLVLAWVGLMIIAAGRAAVRRSSRSFRGAVPAAWLSLGVVSLLTTFTVTGVIVGVQPWYDPQYVIPLCGMVLGNSLTGLSLCLDTLLEALGRDRAAVELRLTLGATAWEAARPAVRAAVRRAMVPILNAMTVVGVVSLPGMMTGQILAGADPYQAVKYQVVVMFMLAASTAVGAVAMAGIVYRRMFNADHQLRSGEIVHGAGSGRRSRGA